jgi:serine/threonine protein kinase
VKCIDGAYSSTVVVDGREYATDVKYESEELAKNAAATRAYMICRNFTISSKGEAPHAVHFYWDSVETSGKFSSTGTFHSATSGRSVKTADEKPPSEWYQHLERIRLIPVAPFDETNWSGRGQHVEFDASDPAEIDSLLISRGILGHSSIALVQKVICKRILLARKKIRCNWRLKREDVIKEVEHPQKLQHSHIVRAVGTYVFSKELCILLYPTTEWNLESFLDACVEQESTWAWTRTDLLPFQTSVNNNLSSLLGFFECMAATMHFVHSRLVKHMDIKPSNFLVKEVGGDYPSYRIYLADFGISRSYQNHEDVETDSGIACSRTRSAPGVVKQETRGFKAGWSYRTR